VCSICFSKLGSLFPPFFFFFLAVEVGSTMGIKKYVLKRLLWFVPLIFLVQTLLFFLLAVIPGDISVLIATPNAPPETIEALREELGLNRPLIIQYLDYVTSVFRGDMGKSFIFRLPVSEVVLGRLVNSLELVTVGMIVAVVVGIPLGVIAAIKKDSLYDRSICTGVLFGISMPLFFIELMVILIFGLYLEWLPVSQRGGPIWTVEGLRHIILPSLCLASICLAMIVRLTRSSMLDVLSEDYILTARSKGLKERVVILTHALKNAMIPVITVIGLQYGFLFGNAVVTEVIFDWPGIGRLAYESIIMRDFPLIRGAVLSIALIFIVINLLIDLIYLRLDPRIEYE